MNQHPRYGGLAYSPQLAAELSRFAGGVQHTARRLRKLAGMRETPLRIRIWGAATPGILAADILATCEGIEVQGLVDRDAKRAALCNRSTRSFHNLSRPVVSPESFSPRDGDAIMVVVNPDAAPEIMAEAQERFPRCPVVSLWQMEGEPSVWPERPPLVVATVGRCGTHWLREMLELMLLPRGYGIADARPCCGGPMDQDAPLSLKLSEFIVDHFRLSAPLLARIREGSMKAVFLYRDPRDVQVSRSYYFRQDYRFDAEEVAEVCSCIAPWLESPALLLRYEDLLRDAPHELGRVADLLELEVPAGELSRIAGYCSFELLSGGRTPGDADPAHHYRKGVAGDWRRHMSPSQAGLLRERHGEALAAMGYEP